MGNTLLPPPVKLSEIDETSLLGNNCSVQQLADYILAGRATNIVLMVGAGISVSAGIPDFRTPGSGLYDNLQKYNLPNPEAMFNIEYFREDPTPFYDLAKDLLPSNFNPTPTHYFIRLLEKKGILRRCYTQNIDTLERRAGVSPDLLVEAHGSFGGAHCTLCGAKYSDTYFKNKIQTMSDGVTSSRGEVIPWCKCDDALCGGNVKPDIVFFGEGLPSRYFDLRHDDMDAADLLIVAGTSLKVAPFSDTMHLCNPKAPRLLINRERVGTRTMVSNGNGFKFDLPTNYRDVELLGSCDTGILTLCELVGWREELEALILEHVPAWCRPSSDLSKVDPDIITKNFRSPPDPFYREDDHSLPVDIVRNLQGDPSLLRSLLRQLGGSGDRDRNGCADREEEDEEEEEEEEENDDAGEEEEEQVEDDSSVEGEGKEDEEEEENDDAGEEEEQVEHDSSVEGEGKEDEGEEDEEEEEVNGIGGERVYVDKEQLDYRVGDDDFDDGNSREARILCDDINSDSDSDSDNHQLDIDNQISLRGERGEVRDLDGNNDDVDDESTPIEKRRRLD